MALAFWMLVLWARTPAQSPSTQAPHPAVQLRLRTKASFPNAAARIAVGDFAGDGKERLGVLEEATGGYSLAVYRWEKSSFVQEWRSTQLIPDALLAGGRFAGKGPAVLVTSIEWVRWNGTSYEEHRFLEPVQPVGAIAGRDGQDLIVMRTGSDFALMRIRPDAPAGDALQKVEGPGSASSYRFGILHSSPEALSAALPPDLALTGLLGLWDVQGDGQPLRIAIRSAASDGKPVWNVVLLAEGESTSEPSHTPAGEVWRGQDIAGSAGDMAIGDVLGGGTLDLIVLAMAPGSSQRSLFIFTPGGKPAASHARLNGNGAQYPPGFSGSHSLKANSASARPQSLPKKPAARTPGQPRASMSVANTVKSGYATPERK